MGQELGTIPQDTEQYAGPPGMIRHWSSGIFIHPKGGKPDPGNDTPLVVHDDMHENMYFRFVQFEGHWGFIEHVASGKVVHPSGGHFEPEDETELVLHSDRHAAALFTYHEDVNTIEHRSGKYIHTLGGSPNPHNDTKVVLHGDFHDGMRWVVVTRLNEVTPLYPFPNVWGRWESISCIIDPETDYSYTLKYKVGKHMAKCNSIRQVWGDNAGTIERSFGGGAAGGYSGFAQHSGPDTFEDEKEVELEIEIEEGHTLVTWQWVWVIEQWGDGWELRSNILTDTDSQDIQPDVNEIPTRLR